MDQTLFSSRMKKYFFNVTIAIISNESAVVMYVFPEKFVVAVDGPQMHRWMPSNYRAFNFTLLACPFTILQNDNIMIS